MSIFTDIIEPALKTNLQDPLQKNYTKAECLIYYNQLHRLLVKVLAKQRSDLGLSALTPIAIAAGAWSVTLPADFFKPYGFFLSGKTYPLNRKKYSSLDIQLLHEGGSTETGEPHYCGLQGWTLYTWPPADVAYTLKGLYYGRPVAATDADVNTPSFNGLFNDVFMEFVAYRCLNRDEARQEWEATWLNNLKEAVHEALKDRKPDKSFTPFRKGGGDTPFILHYYE